MLMRRAWAMPNSDTFTVQPIGEIVHKYLAQSRVSVDPFARNKRWATHTNDINPKTEAEHHLDAEEFLLMLRDKGIKCDLGIMDPPYSPRQISECYKEAGLSVGMTETQNSVLYSRVRRALAQILTPDAIVISCGWNSSGMGQKYGMEIIEILLVAHGGAHNDTIITVEKTAEKKQQRLFGE